MRAAAARVLMVAVVLAVSVVAVPAPASAHVSVYPPAATQGDTGVRVAFLAPTEGQDASTTGLEVHLPDEPPIVGLATVPVPGWTVEVTRQELAEPVEDRHGALITEAVSSITWTADSPDAAVGPGEVGEFPVVFGMLPQVEQLAFRAVQHYSDGEVARWIEVPEPGEAQPHHPAPLLLLQPPGGSAGPDAAAPGTGAGADQPAQDGTATLWIALAGLVAGLAGLALGGLALVRRQGQAPPTGS